MRLEGAGTVGSRPNRNEYNWVKWAENGAVACCLIYFVSSKRADYCEPRQKKRNTFGRRCLYLTGHLLGSRIQSFFKRPNKFFALPRASPHRPSRARSSTGAKVEINPASPSSLAHCSPACWRNALITIWHWTLLWPRPFCLWSCANT